MTDTPPEGTAFAPATYRGTYRGNRVTVNSDDGTTWYASGLPVDLIYQATGGALNAGGTPFPSAEEAQTATTALADALEDYLAVVRTILPDAG